MSVRVGVRSSAVTLGAAVAAVLFGSVCSVDNAGLSNVRTGGAGATGAGGSGARAGAGGAAGGGGKAATGGSGGTVPSGSGGRGSGGFAATGGSTGSGGFVATGGSTGSGGLSGAGGDTGSGGIAGTGGDTGAGGGAGAGGAIGSGGTSGSGAGGGRPPNCSAYPAGRSYTTPTDGLLHCYWVHANQVGWSSAEAVCENEGGTLVTLLSPMENTFVLQVATQAGLFNNANLVFIGASDGKASNDQSGAGDYAWVTGEPWDYHDWHMNQPDGACTGCGGLGGFGCACAHWATLSSDGTWYSRAESTARPFVCEAIAQ
jgi:hypothetical protein